MKFPITKLQRKLPCSAPLLGIPVMNPTHPIPTSHPTSGTWTSVYLQIIVWQHNQYKDIHWMIWGSTVALNLFFFFIRLPLTFHTVTLFPSSVCYTYLARNTLFQMVLHMQWVTKWRFIFLKTVQNSFSKVKSLFHKDRLIHWQVILDTGYMKCVLHSPKAHNLYWVLSLLL